MAPDNVLPLPGAAAAKVQNPRRRGLKPSGIPYIPTILRSTALERSRDKQVVAARGSWALLCPDGARVGAPGAPFTAELLAVATAGDAQLRRRAENAARLALGMPLLIDVADSPNGPTNWHQLTERQKGMVDGFARDLQKNRSRED